MKKSTLFLNNITCIDHCIMKEDGSVEGGSWHPEILVTGNVEGDEQVVVDFSKIKKYIKEIIDSKEHGYDHKLIIPMHILDKLDATITNQFGEDNLKVKGDFSFSIPLNCVKFIAHNTSIEEDMKEEIQNELQSKYDIVVDVQVTLKKNHFGSDKATTFTYYHGLKNSSSYGCKNALHGHTSFIELKNVLGDNAIALQKEIAEYIDGSYFVFKKNLCEDFLMNDEVCVQYLTERGHSTIHFSTNTKHIVMDEETTIENILEFICNKFEKELTLNKIRQIYISEGLQKGAFKEFQG